MKKNKHRQTITTSLDDFHLRFWFEVFDSKKQNRKKTTEKNDDSRENEKKLLFAIVFDCIGTEHNT